MASLTQWTWVWVNSGSWWWTGRPGVLRFMGSQRVGHDWETELNWMNPHCFLRDIFPALNLIQMHEKWEWHKVPPKLSSPMSLWLTSLFEILSPLLSHTCFCEDWGVSKKKGWLKSSQTFHVLFIVYRKSFSLLGISWLPKSRHKQLLVREVRETEMKPRPSSFSPINITMWWVLWLVLQELRPPTHMEDSEYMVSTNMEPED